MKRLFILVFLCCFGVVLHAQQHLTFKSIPIQGSLSEFVGKLKAQGFVVENKYDTGISMKGSFVGFKDCSIIIMATAQTQTVWKVAAFLPDQSSWSSTCSRYEEFKEKYTNKYGKPSEEFEFFMSPYELGDGYELQAIALDKGAWSSYWVSDLGTIVVEINASNNSSGWVRLAYEDAEGVKIMKSEKNAIIDDDI